MKGTTFTDYESFIEYMEQDVPTESRYEANYDGSVAVPVPEDQVGPTTYYDQYGNFVFLRYTPKDGTVLPITVCTEDDLQEARQTAAVRHVIFGAAYCIECLVIVLVYFKKRSK